MGFKPKKCFVCGRIFVPKSNSQQYCSKECSNAYRYERKRMYWDDVLQETVNVEVDDYVGDNVFISNDTLRSTPQLSDKIMTKKILSDFGIKCKIPDCSTVKELNDWKKKKIEEQLVIIDH